MDGNYTFDTFGSDYDTAIAVTQPDCSIGQEFACNDQAAGGDQSSTVVSVLEGDVVHVVIDGYNGATGNYQLNINPYVPDLSCAIEGDLDTATGDAVATGTTVGLADDFELSCAGGGGPDAIYLWTAPDDGTYTFSLAGSDYDTALSLSFACDLPDAICNDDVMAGVLQSEIVADIAADTQIIVVIDGYDGFADDGAVGNYTLAINPS